MECFESRTAEYLNFAVIALFLCKVFVHWGRMATSATATIDDDDFGEVPIDGVCMIMGSSTEITVLGLSSDLKLRRYAAAAFYTKIMETINYD